MDLFGHSEYRGLLDCETTDGSLPVLVALPSDRMGTIFELLAVRYHKGANLVTRTTSGVSVVTFHRAPKHLRMSPLPPECPVHVDSEVSMLVEYLRLHRGPVTCRPVETGYEMELVEDGRSVPV
jgi:hypothetical protein